MIGENGYITLGGIALNKFTEIKIDNQKVDKNEIFDLNYEVENGYGYSHKYIFQETIKNLKNKTYLSPVDYDSVMGTLKLIHSMYRSSEEKKFIRLKDNLLSNFLGKKNI